MSLRRTAVASGLVAGGSRDLRRAERVRAAEAPLARLTADRKVVSMAVRMGHLMLRPVSADC